MDTDVRIQPMLTVRGGKRAVAFYQAAFGAKVVYQAEDPDGNIVARLELGGAEFWVNDGSSDYRTPEGGIEAAFRIVLVVSDVDATYAQAMQAGALHGGGVHEAHGWRTGRFVDPFGHHWEISKPLDGGSL